MFGTLLGLAALRVATLLLDALPGLALIGFAAILLGTLSRLVACCVGAGRWCLLVLPGGLRGLRTLRRRAMASITTRLGLSTLLRPGLAAGDRSGLLSALAGTTLFGAGLAAGCVAALAITLLVAATVATLAAVFIAAFIAMAATVAVAAVALLVALATALLGFGCGSVQAGAQCQADRGGEQGEMQVLHGAGLDPW